MNIQNEDREDGNQKASWNPLSMDGMDDEMQTQTPQETNQDAAMPSSAQRPGEPATGEDTFGAGFDIDAGKRKHEFGMPTEDSRRGRRAKQRGTNPQRAAMRVATGPIKPSRKEVEEHMMCHIPYAPWCKCCVAARALEDAHRAHKEEVQREFPVISMDWCFLSQADDPDVIPTLIIRDSQSKSTFAHGTPGKAVHTEEYGFQTVAYVVGVLDSL